MIVDVFSFVVILFKGIWYWMMLFGVFIGGEEGIWVKVLMVRKEVMIVDVGVMVEEYWSWYGEFVG